MFHEARLDNGLEIVAELNSDVHSVALGFFVRTGARDETAEVSGVSHFLEHMAFKGTAKYSAADVNGVELQFCIQPFSGFKTVTISSTVCRPCQSVAGLLPSTGFE